MTKFTQRILYALAGAALVFATFGFLRSHKASAQELAPPSKMEPLDAARLHAAILEAGQLQEKLQPLLKLIGDSVDKYHLDTDNGRLLDALDWQTGEIHRPQMQPAPAPSAK